jgi:hypothetical protein
MKLTAIQKVKLRRGTLKLETVTEPTPKQNSTLGSKSKTSAGKTVLKTVKKAIKKVAKKATKK